MSGPMQGVLGHIRRWARPRAEAGLTDVQLLERFVARRDEAAFELLVWRHERLVLGVCRRVLRHRQDAEDAFQAAFLALSRQAGSLRDRRSLAGWLYAVAYRAALAARAARSRRARREGPAAALEAVADAGQGVTDPERRELGRVLDEEVMRLPEKYREPVVLYYLQGRPHAEAARALGCPVGTLATRLTRARALLRRRLTRRGVTLPAGAAAALLSREAAGAALVRAAVRAATASGLAALPGSARVAALAEAGVRAGGKGRLALAALVLVVVSSGLAFGLQPASPAPPRAGQAPARQVAPPAGGPRARPAPEKDVTRWGNAVNGLQAGLCFAGGQRPYRAGERVEFVFRLRNASARPVSFTYPFPLFAGGGDPTVCDARGAPLSLHLPAIDIPVHPTPITLAPGRSVDLGRPRILLLSSEAAERLAETALTAPPGRYRVSQRLALEAHAAGEWAGEVVTGTLDLEILRPEPGAAGPGG